MYNGSDPENCFKTSVAFFATRRSFCCSAVSVEVVAAAAPRPLDLAAVASCAAAAAPTSNHSVNILGRDSYTCECP